jgi:hypothetical protein
MGYKLIRKSDGLVNVSKDVTWLEFDDGGKFKERFDEPAIGRSLLMSPFNAFFSWQTTGITKIVRKTKHTITFKTKNSEYKLYKNIK